MQLSDIILETDTAPLWKSILLNGIGISGLSIELNIQRNDSYYWQDGVWGVSGYIHYMDEEDNINNPGYYTYNINVPGFFGVGTRAGFNTHYYASGVINFTQYYISAEYPPVNETDFRYIKKQLKDIYVTDTSILKRVK
jgi:hypothetical protein